MSGLEEHSNPMGPESRLDRLVDGEMSEADRRALLVQLEHEPDGWRRCALAFLEAQCWKQELGLMASRPARAADAALAVPLSLASAPGRQRASWRQYAAMLLTLGACFFIALALGMILRGNWSGGHAPGSATVQTAKDEHPLPNPQPAPQQHAAVPQPADNWELVTLSAADSPDGRAETFRVPAVHRDALDQGMLDQISDAIPPEVQQVLEQSGHQVVQQREFVPVRMNDGSHLVVPVNRVKIHYVGRGSL
jgi:hypothetical protein